MTDFARLATAANRYLRGAGSAQSNYHLVEVARAIARQGGTSADCARRVQAFAAALAEQVEIESRRDVTALRRSGL